MSDQSKTKSQLVQELQKYRTQVAELQVSKQALLESRDRYKDLVDQASDSIFACDQQGNLTYANETALNMLGYSLEELMRFNLQDIIAADDQTETPLNLARLETEEVVLINRVLRRKDGSMVPVEISAKMLPDGSLQGISRDITKRMRAEEALQESEQKFNAFTNQSTEGISVADLDGNYTFVNPAFCKMVGWTEKELLQMTVFDVEADSQDHSSFERSKTVAEGIPITALLKRKDGTEFIAEITGKNLSINGKKRIMGTVRDITESKQAEDELQQRATDLMLINDLNNAINRGNSILEVIQFVSEQTKTIFSCYGTFVFMLEDDATQLRLKNMPFDPSHIRTIEKLMRRPLPLMSIPIKDNGRHWKIIQANKCLIINNRDGIIELARELVNETWVPGAANRKQLKKLVPTVIDRMHFESNAYLPFYSGSEPIGLMVLVKQGEFSQRDLERLDAIARQLAIAIIRKQTEEALAKSEQDLRNLYDNAMEGIFRTTPDGEFLFANPAMAKMFGYDSVDDILNSNAYDLYATPELRDEYKRKYAQNDHHKNEEYEMLRKDGSKIWVRDSSHAIINDVDGTVKYYEGFVSDISKSKKLEQELLKAQKLESVGLLAGGLAHDFNNALTTIQLQTALATLKDDVPAAVMEALEAIEQSVTKAKGITQQMLTFSKGGTPVKTPTDISVLIQESVRFALTGTNVSPTFKIAQDLHNSGVDPNQINQVVSNLVINARHAMPNGGELRVVAKNVSVTPADQLGPLEQGKYISVSIADQGHGIEPANLDKIFDPYFTTKQQGSGLGLFSCYSILAKHGGWLTAESEVSKGSVFTFYLPMSTEDLPAATGEIDSPQIERGTGRILIMDDDDNLRRSLAILLKGLGYTTRETSEGEEAIQVYAEAMETDRPFDLVILDLTIPKGLGGQATVKRLVDLDPDVKAIVSSGYSDDSAIADYKAHGFHAVLPKPYTLYVLSGVVKGTISG